MTAFAYMLAHCVLSGRNPRAVGGLDVVWIPADVTRLGFMFRFVSQMDGCVVDEKSRNEDDQNLTLNTYLM